MMAEGRITWEWEINSKTNYFGEVFKELWIYRYLLGGLVRRNFLLRYQQTLLGPFWILFPPILTLFTYLVVFGKVVRIPTGTLPPVLFYFSGIILWSFFSDSLMGTATTFKDNIHLFSKVYFPRIIMPLAEVSTRFFNLLIQLTIFLLLIVYYSIFKGLQFTIGMGFFWFPVAIVSIGLFAMGLGLLLSVVTAKYRDISHLITLGVRLFMFVTPVIYPLSTVPENARWFVQLNPLTPLFESFRLSILGEGTVSLFHLTGSVLLAIVLFAATLLLFNKQGDKLIDIV